MLPAEIRRQDAIETGQAFDIERLERGEYKLVRRAPPSNQGLIDWLLTCPQKGLLRARGFRVHRRAVTYLADASVLSEVTRPEPDARVLDWLRRREQEIAVDPVILGDLRFGILLLPHGLRRQQLDRWFDGVVSRVTCLPWEVSTGLRWARLLADLRAAGQTMPVKDSLVAATALAHGLTVVTRQVRDFAKAGVPVLDPFQG